MREESNMKYVIDFKFYLIILFFDKLNENNDNI